MVTFNDIPSTATILSTYTSFTASTMLIRTIAKELKTMTTQIIPQPLQQKFIQICGRFFTQFSSQITLIFDQHAGFTLNEIYEAAEIYLRTKITPSVDKLRVSKTPKEKSFLVTVDGGQEIIDIFQGLELKWKLSCTVVKNTNGDDGPYHSQSEKKWFELRCHKKHYNTVMGSYLPYVLQQSKTIKEENKMVMLYSLGIYGYANVNMGNNVWGSVKFDHPATFDTLAMDLKLKNDLLEDLDRFVRRRKFYRRVGKAWKRGYLLYGPPGTGKSSLIAAMANYLNFSIYDLELANLRNNSELRRLLGSTTNRSILVIEDIDCSVELQDRAHFGGTFDNISTRMPIGLQGGPSNNNTQNKTSQLTLSGLLNFIDGLWSSCGDERIIVFTTNHKDRIDPALLRPGRMDMHIHMSYITPCGFKLLASNYLMIDDHFLFKEIEVLIKQVNVTPAEVAEELMKSDDACTSLKGLIDLLYWKKREHDESNAEHGKEGEQESKRQRIESEN